MRTPSPAVESCGYLTVSGRELPRTKVASRDRIGRLLVVGLSVGPRRFRCASARRSTPLSPASCCARCNKRAGEGAMVLSTTCNRTELYAVSDAPMARAAPR